jgi:hypothetical protein
LAAWLRTIDAVYRLKRNYGLPNFFSYFHDSIKV